MNSFFSEQLRHNVFKVNLARAIVTWLVIQFSVTAIPASADDETEKNISVLHNSVAILPFENLSANPDDAYLAMGIHQDILFLLAQIKDISVIAHNGVFLTDINYTNKKIMGENKFPSDMPIAEIASALNVGTIMKGDFQYADNQFNLAVQLFDASGNNQLWSKMYERDLSDIFAVQADIIKNIIKTLGADRSETEISRVEKPLANSIEAYKFYLKARTLVSHLEAGMSPQFYQYIDQAIAIDPDFALAHAVKGTGYGMAYTFGNRSGMSSIADVEKIAAVHTKKALELDPELCYSHMAQALNHYGHGRKAEGKQAYERALKLGPNVTVILNGYAHYLSFLGEDEYAIQLAERAQALTPNDASWHTRLGVPLMFGDKPVEAAYHFREGLKYYEFPWLHRLLAQAEYLSGNRDEAIKHLRISEKIQESVGRRPDVFTAYIYSLMGLKDDAARMVTKLGGKAPTSGHIGVRIWVMANLAIGKPDIAYDILKADPNNGLVSLQEIKGNVMKDPVLEEPRFVELRNQIGSLN